MDYYVDYYTAKPIVVELLHNRTRKVIYRHECEYNTVKRTLMKAVAEGVVLDHVDLRGANLEGATLTRMRAHAATLTAAILTGADLSHADLYCSDMKHAQFKNANLQHTDLSQSDLEYAIFAEAKCRRADFRYTQLRQSNFRYADLYHADFGDAHLFGSDFRGADIEGARLWSTVGDGVYIKSLQIGDYEIAYTADDMQIGCKNFPISDWWAMTDDQIEQLDGNDALEFWHRNKSVLQMVIEANPAAPTR